MISHICKTDVYSMSSNFERVDALLISQNLLVGIDENLRLIEDASGFHCAVDS